MSGMDDKLKRLVRRWLDYADGCDRELKRDADSDSGLVLSPDGRIQHEQSAIIYRKCADELANTPVDQHEVSGLTSSSQ